MTRLATASSIARFELSGVTVTTYWCVSKSVPFSQYAVIASGASSDAATTSTATIVRLIDYIVLSEPRWRKPPGLNGRSGTRDGRARCA